MVPEADESLTRAAYDAVADIYADRIVATEPEHSVELAVIDYFASLLEDPRRVLDAGCGAGRMLPYLAERRCHPEGIDLSPEMVRRANQDHPDYPSRVGSLTALDYPDAVFDGVFSWYSTIHNPDEDLDRMLAELIRVLRPGGLLLVAFQVGEGMRQVGRGYAALGFPVVMNRYHRSVSEMIARLAAQGLELVAQLERGPVGSEVDAQAVVIVRLTVRRP